MDRLLSSLPAVLSSLGPPKQLLFELAAGKYQSCPFPDELLRRGRAAISSLIAFESHEDPEDVVPGQPFHLGLLSALARALGDPDWQILLRGDHCYARGVRLGFCEPLPRVPAVFERKVRWKVYDPEDYALELKDNYASAAQAEDVMLKKFEEERGLGMMLRLSDAEAVAEWGDRLRIAPLGAVPKPGGSFRTIHDGTHGAAVNPEIRLRDQIRYPGPGEAAAVMEDLSRVRGARFGLTADVSRAHRRYLHVRRD